MSDRTAAGVAKARHVESLAEKPVVDDPLFGVGSLAAKSWKLNL